MRTLNINNISFSVHDKKKNIKLPTILTPNLAELCGIHIGDGHLGNRKYKHEYLLQVAGNPLRDREHYDIFIGPIIKKLFNINNLNIRLLPCGCYGFMYYSKAIALFFNKVLGFPFGNKINKIHIPKIIKETCKTKSSKELISCIRGIIDTDFYLNKDRNQVVLGAWFGDKNIVLELYRYLKLLKFSPKIKVDIKYFNSSAKKFLIRHSIRIRKKEDIKNWFRIIGTHNPNFYKRYIFFKNMGLLP